VRTAAVRAEHEKRFQQAVMLYNLAEEYDAVLAVVSAELAASLSRGAARTGVRTSPSTPFYRAESDPRDSSDQEDVGSTARAVLQHYTSNSRIAMRVSAKSRQTCEMLLHLREGIQLHEAGKLEQALAVSGVYQIHRRLNL
jgi:nuclear pore complex protein Nup93